MDRFTMYPVALITTIQPWVTAWVLAISFFVTMLIVALVAKHRTAKQVAAMALLGYLATTIAVGVGTAQLSGLQMVTVEVVSVTPSNSFEEWE